MGFAYRPLFTPECMGDTVKNDQLEIQEIYACAFFVPSGVKRLSIPRFFKQQHRRQCRDPFLAASEAHLFGSGRLDIDQIDTHA